MKIKFMYENNCLLVIFADEWNRKNLNRKN